MPASKSARAITTYETNRRRDKEIAQDKSTEAANGSI
jgi:hypothetical protein